MFEFEFTPSRGPDGMIRHNTPAFVADAYARDLAGPFAGVFDEVVFAVLDWSADRHFVRPFVERFG